MKKGGVKYREDVTSVYRPDQINEVLTMAVNENCLVTQGKHGKVYNVPCSFDIETSSFYRDEDGHTYSYKQAVSLGSLKDNLEKCSIMYVWQFGINGFVIVGRTWDEFTEMINFIIGKLGLCESKRLIIYVHNLSYEFQFIRKLFDWAKVFSIDMRKPIYATTDKGVEFRCSYLLSGYSLEKLGSQLRKYKCEKMAGDLDYTLLRHSSTPLTDKEIGYCVNDVKVVMCYIMELIESEKGIHRIPLTKTGFVRNYCRKNCLYEKRDGKRVANYGYQALMNELHITSMKEFDALQRAFAGGFTHANAHYSDETQTDVDSYDFTSSYPYAMVSEMYPMSRAVEYQPKNMKEFEHLIKNFCCVFDVEFTNIFQSVEQDTPISVSKCFVHENVVENNGRVSMAGKIVLTITDVDFNVIRNFYQWENMRVGTMFCYKRGYLPTEFVKSILHLYEMKTRLKGVEGKESEYANSKEMLNSCYGMCVTNPLRDEFTYIEDWDIKEPDTEMKSELLYKYNMSRSRFLFYPWGIFVTAYSRRNLFTGIYSVGDDYIYSDTDSIKLKHGDSHKEYFDTYNRVVEKKLKTACAAHGISYSQCAPETIKGVIKTLGVWDYEGRYRRFRTLGAKRYMIEEDNALKAIDGKTYDYSLTVSGVNKKYAVPYLVEKYGAEIFDHFTDKLEIPPERAGKNIHTYIDYSIHGKVTDYLGETNDYFETTGVHLEPTGYNMSLSVAYLNFITGLRPKNDSK